nr:Arm DNA-binding domain-containing protein [Orientia tsutsugamushi]
MIHSDKVVKWLRARKSSSGRVTLYVEQKFKNQSLKITIGVFPDLSVREARKKAIELKTLMANRIDPREVRR